MMRVDSLIDTISGIRARASTWLNLLLIQDVSQHECISDLQDTLQVLNLSTESEFLSVGARLQDFSRQAKEISDLAASAAELISGEKTSGIELAYERIVDSIKSMQEEPSTGSSLLRLVLEKLEDMRRRLEGFGNAARTLKMLCVSIKIENARLGLQDAGFSSLTDDVTRLALEIESKHRRFIDEIESLDGVVSIALFRASDIEARQHSHVKALLDSTMESLTALARTHQLSCDCAAKLSQRYASISRDIGEIVTSLQFHDITRQRIDHVCRALEGIKVQKNKAWILGQNGGKQGLSNGQAISVFHVCRLQHTQLLLAADELITAIERIIERLHNIACLVSEISHDMDTYIGGADSSSSSLISEIEAGCASMLPALTTHADSSRELSSCICSAGDMLSQMSQSTRDIESIGIKIKLIALNAIIKASHIGNGGASLGILAESIHRLSVETCLQTEALMDCLSAIASSANTLITEADRQTGEIGEKVEHIDEELASMMAALREVRSSSLTSLQQMREKGDALSKSVEAAATGIEVHRKVDETIRLAVSKLEEMETVHRSKSPDSILMESSEHLLALEATYTMQRERDAHNSFLSGDLIEADAGKLGTVTERKEDDLGDNVELF